MKNAALILGIMGGMLALVMALWAGGWLLLTRHLDPAGTALEAGAGPGLLLAGLVAPLLALAGGAMAVLRPGLAAVLMLLAAAGIFAGLGWGLLNAVPVALCALGGVLALVSGAVIRPSA